MSERETTQYDSYESDQAFAQAYYLVMGKSPPFGRNFNYQHALEDIKATVNLLRQAIRDFERERNAKVTP